MGAPYEAGMGVQILMLLRFDWTIPDPIPYLLPGGFIVPGQGVVSIAHDSLV